MSGEATVTPGASPADGDRITNAILRLLAAPTVRVNPGAISTRELDAAAVRAILQAAASWQGSTTILDRSADHLTPGVFKSADFVSGTFPDGALVIGSTTLTSATAAFSSADNGRSVVGANIPNGTTLTYVNPTTATLSQAAAQQYSDGTISGGTTLTSPTAGFSPADNGRVVTGAGIVAGTTLTYVDATTATLSQAAANGPVTFQVNGRPVSNVTFTVNGRGKGWRFTVGIDGVSTAEIYTGTAAGSSAGGLSTGSFVLNADGSIKIGLGSMALTIDKDGNATWGSGSAKLGITKEGRMWAGAPDYSSAALQITESGDVTILSLATSNHNIATDAVNPAVQDVTVAPAGGAITNPTNVTLDCKTSFRRIYYRLTPSDGVTNGTTTFTSAGGNFTKRDEGKDFASADFPAGTFIVSVTNATTIVLNNAASGSHTAQAYSITPNQTDALYVDGTPIVLTGTRTLTTRAYKNGEYSALASYVFTVDATTAPNPSFSPAPGTYSGGSLAVTISSALAGSVIFYTKDGTTPTHDGSLNPTGTTIKINSTSGVVTLSTGSTTLKALVAKTGVADSGVASAAYTVTSGAGSQAATPVFSPAGFVSAGHATMNVTISTTTPGAQIRYTKDGSTPTDTHGTLIAGTSGTASIPGHTFTNLKAVAFKTGLLTSVIRDDDYDFSD